mmetsp:Transcript_11057/g.11158  ORF Transcript_11057/g.11158 Transcript_11057/m.11158 type:complete len:80 (-) Transcript_11057:71-310(-)
MSRSGMSSRISAGQSGGGGNGSKGGEGRNMRASELDRCSLAGLIRPRINNIPRTSQSECLHQIFSQPNDNLCVCVYVRK